LHIGGAALQTVREYYLFALAVFAIVLTVLYFVNASRTGRAWRALREDPLAAELMGMPVNRLKLLAFVFGAGVAGLVGTIFVSLQVGVFPANFDISLLITIYAMVILGGAGSVGGVVLGAITINVVLEVLRTPDNARMAFYAVVVVALFAFMRPLWRPIAVAAATIALGYAVNAIAEAAWPGAVAGTSEGGGWLARWVDGWVPLLTHPDTTGNIAYAALLLCVALLSQLRGIRRTVALAPTLYLAAFVWENRLVANPSVTRLLLVGALLVALMNARPQGLLGTARVEIA
jgi:ABC-type branched-subunit amino acid transport system permease subunit